MKLLKKNEIQNQIDSNILSVSHLEFLDDYRIGISLSETYYKISESVTLTESVNKEVNILSKNTELTKNTFYLFQSKQNFCIPKNIIGFIQTRSKYARIGLELAQSSLIIIPGFGMTNPAPLVLELCPKLNISGLTLDECYGYVLLFSINPTDTINPKDYTARFPFNNTITI